MHTPAYGAFRAHHRKREAACRRGFSPDRESNRKPPIPRFTRWARCDAFAIVEYGRAIAARTEAPPTGDA